MLGLLYFFGLYARSAAVFDSTTVQVALVLAPFTVSLVVLAQLSSWMSRRFGRSAPVVVGMVLMGSGFLLLARTSASASEGDLVAALTLCGVGAGVANAAVVGPGILRASDARLDEAAGLASLARFAGTAFAVALGTVSYLGVGHHAGRGRRAPRGRRRRRRGGGPGRRRPGVRPGARRARP